MKKKEDADLRTINLSGFVNDVTTALRERGLEALSGPGIYEVGLVIDSWAEQLGIERTWPADLHPADVLDKYVFPAILADFVRPTSEVRENHVCGDAGCIVPHPAPHKKHPGYGGPNG